jgi:hypothetical protein
MKSFIHFGLITLLLVSVSCSKKVQVAVGGLSEETLGQDEFPPSSVAIKNYEQVNATYSVLTQVPRNNNNVRNAFNNLQASLLVTNDLVNMGPSVQLANFKLAQEYCREATLNGNVRLADNTEVRRWLYPVFNFDQVQNPVQMFGQNLPLKSNIVKGLISKFWGEGINAPETAEVEYLRLFDDLVAGVQQNQNNTNQTREILVGVCTAVLAAAPTIIF